MMYGGFGNPPARARIFLTWLSLRSSFCQKMAVRAGPLYGTSDSLVPLGRFKNNGFPRLQATYQIIGPAR